MNAKQQRFVEEYPKDLNGKQAAIRAGYSEKTAEAQASRLLSNVKVAAAVRAALNARSERTKIDSDWVLERLAQEAEADFADLYDENGHVKPVHEWPKIWRQGLVAGLETETRMVDEDSAPVTITKLKISDRVKRLELIGRHTNIQAWKDNVNLSMNEVIKKDWRGQDPS